MNSEAALNAARMIAEARQSKTPLNVLPEQYSPTCIEEGYQVQNTLHKYLNTHSLGKRAGYKIGCTTPVMQAYLGINHPCAGSIPDQFIYHRTAKLSHSKFVFPGVECEIVARLGRDIPNEIMGKPEEIEPYVDAVMIGIEIVDDRYADFRSIGIPTLIADDFFNAGCVLGDPVTNWLDLDLKKLVGGFTIDGKAGPRGRGADIMGNPLEALGWFAHHMTSIGRQLQAGDFIMLGSIVKTYWFDSPGKATANISELGNVSLEFQ